MTGRLRIERRNSVFPPQVSGSGDPSSGASRHLLPQEEKGLGGGGETA
jgi:hypothetical protein